MDQAPKNDFENRLEFIALEKEFKALVIKSKGDDANLTPEEKLRRDTIYKVLVPPHGGSAN